VLADGQEWLLADYAPTLSEEWDRLYDGNVVFRKYQAADVRLGAWALLLAGYDLTRAEAATLIIGADLTALVQAVEVALFGPARRHRTYSQWVCASLWSVGVDPDRIPPDMIRPVLEILVATGRTPPEAEFISAAEAAVARAGWVEMAQDLQREQRRSRPPESQSDPEPEPELDA
jgi:hypothetical protein